MHWVCEDADRCYRLYKAGEPCRSPEGIKRLVTWNEVDSAGCGAVNRQMGYVHRMHELQMLLC